MGNDQAARPYVGIFLLLAALGARVFAANPGLATEYKLVDALTKADRAVEQALLKKDEKAAAKAFTASSDAGEKLTAFCVGQKKQVGVKVSGMLGCLPSAVTWPVKPKK